MFGSALAAAVGVFYLACGWRALAAPAEFFGPSRGGAGTQHYVRDAAAVQLAVGMVAVVASCRALVLRPLILAVTAVGCAALVVHAVDGRVREAGDVPPLALATALGAAAALLARPSGRGPAERGGDGSAISRSRPKGREP
jgi:peptidoglycan/LPS O-acetylase OafA/YrhL